MKPARLIGGPLSGSEHAIPRGARAFECQGGDGRLHVYHLVRGEWLYTRSYTPQAEPSADWVRRSAAARKRGTAARHLRVVG